MTAIYNEMLLCLKLYQNNCFDLPFPFSPLAMTLIEDDHYSENEKAFFFKYLLTNCMP